MSLTKQHLIDIFNSAREQVAKYVMVAIEAEGTQEVIVVPNKSFDAKEKFYMSAYTDELVHVMNSKVRIVGLAYGDEMVLTKLV